MAAYPKKQAGKEPVPQDVLPIPSLHGVCYVCGHPHNNTLDMTVVGGAETDNVFYLFYFFHFGCCPAFTSCTMAPTTYSYGQSAFPSAFLSAWPPRGCTPNVLLPQQSSAILKNTTPLGTEQTF